MHSSFSASLVGSTVVTSDPRLIIQRDTGEYLAVCRFPRGSRDRVTLVSNDALKISIFANEFSYISIDYVFIYDFFLRVPAIHGIFLLNCFENGYFSPTAPP